MKNFNNFVTNSNLSYSYNRGITLQNPGIVTYGEVYY